MGREENYIVQYKGQWDELENYIQSISRKGYSHLSPADLKNYLLLMKRVSHHLAYTRTHFPESQVCNYLNELSVRANNHLYVVRRSTVKEIIYYITTDFALRIRKNRAYILCATVLFMIGFIISFILVQLNLQNATFFLPEEYLQQTDWSLSESGWNEEQFFFLSSYIMVNNISVAIKAFAYGITAGIMTIGIIFMNGTMIGALTSLVAQNSNHMWNYWALILPHGIIELCAIFISGGAGLMIGKALLIPGQYKRGDALIKAAKEAAMLMPGVIMMLVIAGLIEGFFTPARIIIEIKLGFAGCTAIMSGLYLILRRKKIRED